MFRKFFVENYRAIAQPGLWLPLTPLTVIVGPSGAGKSSIIEAIALTSQSAIEDPSRYDLVLNGSIIDIPNGTAKGYEIDREIYNAKDISRKLRVGFEIEIDKTKWQQAGLGKTPPPIIKDAPWPPETISYSWGRRGMDGARKACWSHIFSVDGETCFEIETTADRNEPPGSFRTQFRMGNSSGLRDKTIELGMDFERVLHERIFTNGFINSVASSAPEVLKVLRDSTEFLQFLKTELVSQLEKTSFLSGLRGKQLMQNESGPEPRRIGQHAELAKRLLASRRARRHPAYQKLVEWAARFNLNEIDSSLISSNEISVSFLDKATNSFLEIESAAAGSIQGLLVATQLLIAEPGSCHLIEEPEIHMHPKFEAELAKLFSDAVGLGQQLVITTHSEILISAIANAVRSNRISSDQVSIWHLDRNTEGEIKKEKVQISKKGNLEGWISSFRDIEEELFDEWSQALPVAEEKNSD